MDNTYCIMRFAEGIRGGVNFLLPISTVRKYSSLREALGQRANTQDEFLDSAVRSANQGDLHLAAYNLRAGRINRAAARNVMGTALKNERNRLEIRSQQVESKGRKRGINEVTKLKEENNRQLRRNNSRFSSFFDRFL